MTSNSRKPTLSKAEATHLRMPVRSYKAVCVIAVIAMVLLVASGCSRSSSDSRQLADYISGFVQLEDFDDVPVSASLSDVFSRVMSESDYERQCERSSKNSDFYMELRSRSGRALCRWSFDAVIRSTYDPAIIFDPETGEYYNTIDETFKKNRQVPFSFIVNNPPDYSSIAVLHGDEEVLVQYRSANRPSLSIQGPPAGQVFNDGDSVTLSWEGSDLDGDKLDYLVFYSTDGGNSYERLRIAGRNSPKTISANRLENSPQARLAVSVSDGTRSAFAETEIFTVAEHVPAETTIIPANQPPRAYDDASNGYVGEALRIYVLRNDIYSTKDFGPNSLKIDVPPSFGVAYVNGETVKIIRPSDTEWEQTFRLFIEYTPGSAGIDTLTYSICNRDGECDSAQVTITSIVNQPPVANDDVAGGDIGEVLRIDVLANDIDAEKDFDYESLVIDVPPIFGTASVKSEYTETWDREHFIEYYYASSAIDSLTYSICDTFDQCDTAEVTIKAGTADCTIIGTEDDDTIRGTSDDDVICGLEGNDTIHAGGGNDIIRAGLGDDVVFAGSGDDTIYGEDGDDTIDSGTGDDIVRGSDGNDRITGGDGADGLYGGLGDDILDGGAGDDTIYGSKGDDTIYGGPGDDTIRGNLGADTIYPGRGNDTLEGPTEADTIIQ